VLAEQVFAGGRSKPFAELTADEVKARAAELKAATGWGPTAKVASVAMAWAELARLMEQSNASTVGELEPDAVAARAEKLWVVPPGGSLL
jgi:predicted DNA-binding transcriptional regulator YafY